MQIMNASSATQHAIRAQDLQLRAVQPARTLGVLTRRQMSA